MDDEGNASAIRSVLVDFSEGAVPEVQTEQGDVLRISLGDGVYRLENGLLRFDGREEEIAWPPLK